MYFTLKQYCSWYSIKIFILENLFKLIYYINLFWTYLATLFNSNLENSVIFIKDNKIIDTNEESDFCVKIYTNNNKTLIKVSNDTSLEEFEECEEREELECCDFNFILVLLKLRTDNAETYTIDITSILKNKTISYYVANAILFDKNFNDWLSIRYLTNKMGLGNVINIEEVDIIDQYAEHFSITNKQYLKLNKTKYSICDYK